jgi:hypothetical protein
MYGEQATDSRPRYDRTHPGFHLNVSMESNSAPLEYRRETNLETGEISVFWTDNRGNWVRRIFVSRTHSAASQGNLPKAIDTYTSFLERYVEHWRENAKELYGMPAVLMEMLVYSEPGLIEFLPALPQDKFGRETLRGVLARGGVTVEELHWNKTLGNVFVTLRSGRAQSLVLRFGVELRFVDAENPADRNLVSKAARGRWRIELPANRSVRLLCRR